MAQVVHAWRAGASGRGPAQPAAQQPEGVVGGVVADPVAAVGAEERRIRARRAEAPRPVLGVAAQRVQRAGMQRHHPGAAAFAGADGQHALGQVDVGAGQGQRFADPQARCTRSARAGRRSSVAAAHRPVPGRWPPAAARRSPGRNTRAAACGARPGRAARARAPRSAPSIADRCRRNPRTIARRRAGLHGSGEAVDAAQSRLASSGIGPRCPAWSRCRAKARSARSCTARAVAQPTAHRDVVADQRADAAAHADRPPLMTTPAAGARAARPRATRRRRPRRRSGWWPAMRARTGRRSRAGRRHGRADGGQRMAQQVRPARRRIHAGPRQRGVHGAADAMCSDHD